MKKLRASPRKRKRTTKTNRSLRKYKKEKLNKLIMKSNRKKK